MISLDWYTVTYRSSKCSNVASCEIQAH